MLFLSTIITGALYLRADRAARAATAAQRQSDRRWYGAEMNLAYQDWKDGYTRLAESRLARQENPGHGDDLRGFEWYLLGRLCRMELATLAGPTAPVRCVAFAPDGAFLASAAGGPGQHAEIRIWKMADRTVLSTLHPPWTSVFSLAYGPGGLILAAGAAADGGSGECRLWDVDHGRELTSILGQSGKGDVRAVAFSPRGNELALGGRDGTIRLVGAQGTALRELKGHQASLTCVAYSPDGKRLASTSRDGAILCWDLATGTSSLLLHSVSDSTRLAFSPDGTLLAATGQKAVVPVWDASSGREVHMLNGHTDPVRGISFSPEGKYLASSSDDRTVRLWDLATGEAVFTLRGHAEPVLDVAFSPDLWRLASAGGDGTVKLWDAVNPQEFRPFIGHRSSVHAVAFNPDGSRIASAGSDRSVRVFDVATEREVLMLSGHVDSVIDVAYSPDGSRIASAGYDGSVRIWDAVTGAQQADLRGHTTPVHGLAFGPDRSRLVSGGTRTSRRFIPIGGELFVWDVPAGKKIRALGAAASDGDPRGYLAVDFSRDGRTIAAACGDRTVRFWDASSGAPGRVLHGHEDRIRAMAFSRDGVRIATAGDDRTIRLWNVASGEPIAIFRGHTAPVRGVAFSPDGNRLASVSGGHNKAESHLASEVKLWDLATGQEVLTLRERTAFATDIAFSPDGRRLATADADFLVTIWDGAEPTPELRVGRQARSLVGRLFEGSPKHSLDKVRRRLEIDPSIDDEFRRAAMARALTEEEDFIRQKADDLANTLLLKPLFREEAIEALRHDPALDANLRREAIRIAQQVPEKPRQLDQAARKVVRRSDASHDLYLLALRRAEAACRLVPIEGAYRTTLGMAQYRLGRNQEAVDTLTAADALNSTPEDGPMPADWAFRAMALYRMGRHDEDQAALGRLQQIVKGPEWAGDNEAQALLREAQALFAESPQDSAPSTKTVVIPP